MSKRKRKRINPHHQWLDEREKRDRKERKGLRRSIKVCKLKIEVLKERIAELEEFHEDTYWEWV